jgi:diaminohydroxyphosphoribosylaminopyrimidine deaminase/5-amino-6-(5-phosphoribosylamino)uracil reductase
MNKDELYMQRALDLARLGLGAVSPNPMVGCVIVHQDEIIGEGYHKVFGGPHAEVNALNNVKRQDLIPESTVYVNLEPCSHYGKTPPCSQLLISKRVRKVVIGMADPNPRVAGQGIQQLESAGIEVEHGILKGDCAELNRRFLVNQKLKRPFVILKWAQTADGFIARKDGSSKWISSAGSRRLVHKWRAEEDAILIGAATARVDNPSLTVRDWEGIDPLRVVLDRNNTLSNDLNLFTDGKMTYCYTALHDENSDSFRRISLGKNYSIRDVLSHLMDNDIGSLLVEGGARILHEFIISGLWDEARIFTSRSGFGEGIAAPMMPTGTLVHVTEFDDKLQWHINNASAWQKN